MASWDASEVLDHGGFGGGAGPVECCELARLMMARSAALTPA
jgi:hypothetical protein